MGLGERKTESGAEIIYVLFPGGANDFQGREKRPGGVGSMGRKQTLGLAITSNYEVK